MVQKCPYCIDFNPTLNNYSIAIDIALWSALARVNLDVCYWYSMVVPCIKGILALDSPFHSIEMDHCQCEKNVVFYVICERFNMAYIYVRKRSLGLNVV